MEEILQIANLRTYFFRRFKPTIKAVDGVSYKVKKGETIALVGESGCGKTISALSILRLNPPTSTIVEGQVKWLGHDILKVPDEEICRIRGKDIAMIFQNPLSSLNPLMTIGRQISETFQTHHCLCGKDSWNEAKRMLNLVAVPDVESKMTAYPFQLSGGMRQRVMVAMALSCDPKLMIADEPTTALDVTTQAQILSLICTANREAGRATILVTHDLGIVARYADTVNIMYAGHIVESAGCMDIYHTPLHPYTEALLKSVPRIDKIGGNELIPIPGYPPLLDRLGPGCPFEARCTRRTTKCLKEMPPIEEVSENHYAACWHI
ncbi:MAG: ABC transporter ATP-binding protein [Deltaproteobacteria bacterium]|nr:ABC transporter ATP-binding protein [Deltaproteobacteria bacterium]